MDLVEPFLCSAFHDLILSLSFFLILHYTFRKIHFATIWVQNLLVNPELKEFHVMPLSNALVKSPKRKKL